MGRRVGGLVIGLIGTSQVSAGGGVDRCVMVIGGDGALFACRVVVVLP